MNKDLAIETRELVKRYGQHIVAVNKLSMRVYRGEVYGFLGPNGAGKTTTLRILAGLIHPSSGSAAIFGAAPGSEVALESMGVMVEAPAFYPYLSGRDNLTVLARYAGVAEDRIGPALERVQLADRAGDRFSGYSLGMKQRLGVAAALLKDPKLLILDEPTNGLDPAGMAGMRRLIRDLGHDGRTVLVSSHLMSEVEQICDRVGVIRAGSLIADGSIDELRGHDRIVIRANPIDEARRVLAGIDGVAGLTGSNGRLDVAADPALVPALNRALVAAGVDVSELHQERGSLEEAFLELTQPGELDGREQS